MGDSLELEQMVKVNEKLGKLIELNVRCDDQSDSIIVLLGAIRNSNDEILKVNQKVLEVKKAHFDDWTRSAGRRFYIAFIGAMLTGAVLYLDVLKLDENSAIVSAFIELINVAKVALF